MATSSSLSSSSSSNFSRSVSCWVCYKYAAPNLKAVIRHIGAVHAHDPGFHICCGIEGCSRVYKVFHSFRRHVYRKHHCHLDLNVVNSSLLDEIPSDNEELDISTSLPSQQIVVCQHPDIKKQTALFLLKAKEIHKVSQTALDGLLADVTILFKQCLDSEVKRKMKNFPNEVHVELQQIIDDLDLFQGLHSKYKQEKYYKENLNIVEPLERVLGQKVQLTHHSRPHIKTINECVYDIPLLKSLKQLLCDELIIEEILRGHKRSDNLLSDYCDGTAFKSHQLFSSEPCSLQLFIYYDELEVCNPLGTKTKTHKLGIFYYTLGNISPQYRSQLKAIQLLTIGKASIIVKYGSNTILEAFSKDLKVLEEEGITIDELHFVIRGTVTIASGDNLGSTYIGGFKSPSGSFRKCRHCMATGDDINIKFVSSAFIPRTRDAHSQHVKALEGAAQTHASITYGITKNSILNSSKYFHVTEGLAPDIMHDMLEGVAQYEFKELLKHLIHKKYITLNVFNGALENFSYSYADIKDKPTAISSNTLYSSDHNVKQKAAQMWCLSRLVPLIIGHLVPTDDEHWVNFLLLLTIIDYLFAPVVSHDVTSHLRVIIEDHHIEFIKLYPHCSMTPKFHYMVHYPDWIEKCGPLVRFWCMRYEAKHNYFKNISQRIKCFRNIPKSLANHHQRLMCLYINSDSGLNLRRESVSGPGTQVSVNDLPYQFKLLETKEDISRDSMITRMTWMEFNGIRYKIGGVVVLSMDLVPSFCLIKDVIILDTYYLVCEQLQTVAFESHYHAFEVSHTESTNYVICSPSELFDYNVLGLHNISGHIFVTLKYFLVENLQ